MASIDVTEILRGSSSGQPVPKKARLDDQYNGDGVSGAGNREDMLAALDEDSGQGVTVDDAYVKKYTSMLEKKALKNREMRIKHADDPKKFMDSEIELDTAIQEMHSLATQPDLYGCFIEVGGPPLLLSLLTHENADIIGATINLLQELTDVDVLNESDEGALELIDCLLKGRIVETFVTCFDKFDEKKKDDADALHGALGVVESMIEVRKEAAEECVNQGMFIWLLRRACAKGTVDANKEYASELLAILLQMSDPARKKLTEKLDGIDVLLRALAVYKRHDPSSPTEKEHMENLFNALCSALLWTPNRAKFLDGEGLQLMNLMLREKKQSRNSALKVLNHATAGPEGRDNCNKFVEILGLRTLFPLFMKTLSSAKKKDTSPDEHEEHVCSILGALFRSCDEEARQRMMQKFVEHEHEKIDRAVELFLKYKERMNKFDVKLAKDSVASDNEDEDEKYLNRLEAGLFTLQTISLILLDVCSNTYTAMKRASKLFFMKLKQDKVSRVLLPIVSEYQQNLGLDAQDESQRIDVLVEKLMTEETEAHTQ